MIEGGFNAFPLSMGSLYGRRAFHVASNGTLKAVFARYHWKDGENIAECEYTDIHERVYGTRSIPAPPCMCGFWSYHNTHDTDLYPHDVHGIVEVYGKTIVGSLGFRSEKARIVALVLPAVAKNKEKRLWHPVKWMTNRIHNHGAAAGIQWLTAMIGLSAFTVVAEVSDPIFWVGLAWWLYFGIGAAISITREWKGIDRIQSFAYTPAVQRLIAEKYPNVEIYASNKQMYAAYAERMDILKDAPEFKDREVKTSDR